MRYKTEYRDACKAVREELNVLSEDEAVQKERLRATRFVTDRLDQSIYDDLAKQGLTRTLWDAFYAETEPGYTEACNIMRKSLPQEKKKQFDKTLPLSKKEASRIFLEHQKWKTRIAFRKEAKITPTIWDPFLQGNKYIEDATFHKIVETLKLTEDEKKLFRFLLPKENYPATAAMLKQLTVQMQAKRYYMDEYHIDDFLHHSMISQKAWYHLHHDNTSQTTMLKLIIALAMDEKMSRQLLHLVNSDFFIDRDMVVLACIHCNYYEVGLLYEILQYFAYNPNGTPFFKNLYQF